jgi:hypothetical protein
VPEPEGTNHCARGDWCSERTSAWDGAEQVITPAPVSEWRPWCDGCEEWIGYCLRDLPGYWLRLAAMTGDPLQSETPVRTPFGPQLPVREDVDAHMRMMAAVLAGWEMRIRRVARYSLPQAEARIDTPEAVRDTCDFLRRHIRALLTLDRQPMRRTFSLPLSEEIAAMIADEPSFGTGSGYVSVMWPVGGREAGQEVLHLHYRCRSLLLETSPPAELLIPPCRRCYHRALRRAWPTGTRDVFSRCDNCGDEMSSEHYDANARRRLVAEQRGRELPVLGDVPVA